MKAFKIILFSLCTVTILTEMGYSISSHSVPDAIIQNIGDSDDAVNSSDDSNYADDAVVVIQGITPNNHTVIFTESGVTTQSIGAAEVAKPDEKHNEPAKPAAENPVTVEKPAEKEIKTPTAPVIAPALTPVVAPAAPVVTPVVAPVVAHEQVQAPAPIPAPVVMPAPAQEIKPAAPAAKEQAKVVKIYPVYDALYSVLESVKNAARDMYNYLFGSMSKSEKSQADVKIQSIKM